MGGFAQAITQGVGRAGNELEGARTGLRQEKQQGAFDQLKMLQTVLGLIELQKKIKQMGLPQYQGTVGTSGGGTGAITLDPNSGKPSMQTLVPGASKEQVSAQIRSMSAKSQSKEYRTALDSMAQAVDQGLIDPIKAMDEALRMMGTEAGKETTKPTPFKFEPNKGVISGAEGKEWSIYDPQLPADLKKLVDAEQRRTEERDKQKSQDEIRRSDLAMKRALGLLGARDAEAASKEARTAKALADDVAKNLEAAKRGNAKASLALVFAAVRTMVQGAGRMTNVEIEQELKAGSLGQRMQRWWEQASKGVLPEDQMGMIQEVVVNGYESKRGVAAETWQYAMPDKPLPPWLKPQAGAQKSGEDTPPPPPGYEPEKKP